MSTNDLLQELTEASPFSIDKDLLELQYLTRVMLKSKDRFEEARTIVEEAVNHTDSKALMARRDQVRQIIDAIADMHENGDRILVDLHGSFGKKATAEDYVKFAVSAIRGTISLGEEITDLDSPPSTGKEKTELASQA